MRDRLSGQEDVPRISRSLAAYVGLIVGIGIVVLAGTLARQTGVPSWHTVWAEDGNVFSWCAYSQSLMDCLPEPYAGWLHVVPRLTADIAVLGDPTDIALRVTLIAGLVAALAAIIAGIAVYEVTDSPLSGLITGSGLVLVWPAVTEVAGVMANLHWVLLAASIVVAVCVWLGRPPGIAGLILMVFTVLSSPIAPPVLLLLALVGIALRSHGARLMTAVVLVASLPQVLTVATSPRRGLPPDPGLGGLVALLDQAIVKLGTFGEGQTVANLTIVGVAVFLGVVLASQQRRREALAVLSLVSLGMLILLGSLVLNHAYGPRYSYTMGALNVAAVALGAGLVTSHLSAPLRRVGRLAVAAILGLGFAVTFYQWTLMSMGPDVTAQLESRDCTGVPATKVLISPGGVEPEPWSFIVPCR